jgi:hypothetical protein
MAISYGRAEETAESVQCLLLGYNTRLHNDEL